MHKRISSILILDTRPRLTELSSRMQVSPALWGQLEAARATVAHHGYSPMQICNAYKKTDTSDHAMPLFGTLARNLNPQPSKLSRVFSRLALMGGQSIPPLSLTA